jgi:L1 cell adhesion molecule like protein
MIYIYFAGTHRIYWSTCFKIIEGIAQGLHYLHARGVLHLDLKPDNVLFDSDMNPVIADFGLSRAMEKYAERTSNVMGTV